MGRVRLGLDSFRSDLGRTSDGVGSGWVGLGSDFGRSWVGVGRAWVEVGSEYEFDPPTGEIIVLVLNPYITHRRAGEGSISNFSPMIK